MAVVSSLLANCLVPCIQSKKLPILVQRCNRIRIPIGGFCYFLGKHPSVKCVNYVGRDYNQLTFNDNIPEEPFWRSLIKEVIRVLKSLIVFLVEQPSQLKYIEWPGFQSTLKTATLTLVLVALLIVALSSVDSALSFMLALLLRRTP